MNPELRFWNVVEKDVSQSLGHDTSLSHMQINTAQTLLKCFPDYCFIICYTEHYINISRGPTMLKKLEGGVTNNKVKGVA